jgi:hypothetical protein
MPDGARREEQMATYAADSLDGLRRTSSYVPIIAKSMPMRHVIS